jgi:hypothetical protein
MRMRREGCHNRKNHRQHDHVVAIDHQCALPQLATHALAVLRSLVDVEGSYKHGRQENEAFRRGNEPERLIDQLAEPCRQVS